MLSLQIEHKCILSPDLWDELLLYVPRCTPDVFPRVLPLQARHARALDAAWLKTSGVSQALLGFFASLSDSL